MTRSIQDQVIEYALIHSNISKLKKDTKKSLLNIK